VTPGRVRAEQGQAGERGNGGGAFQVETSRVYIFVGKVGLGHEHAVAGKLKSGAVQLGASRQAGEIVFDMSAFAADTNEAREYFGMDRTVPEGRRKEVTDNMKGAEVLDVRKHPTATFKIDSALPLNRKSGDGNDLYCLDGEFTLHGHKRPLKIDAEISEQNDGYRLIGSFKIKQTDYGIRPFSKAFGAVGVTDELTIHGDLVVAPARAAQTRTAQKREATRR
ncbi:MAG TPA: YceI family protein, partial [Pirellulales bacterium]|nr:YceI family protein [Pirellulales bacterium]